MLCGMAGSGAVRADNEEQTFAGLGAAAVGGPCSQAITAGGSRQEDGKRGSGRREQRPATKCGGHVYKKN